MKRFISHLFFIGTVMSLLLPGRLLAKETVNQLSSPDWYRYGLNPWTNDTDNDGYIDLWELKNNYCPTFPGLIALTDDRFMNSLGTRYTMYFNKKYKRVGTLYQSVYKAAPLTNEKQFLNLSRYIHKQAYKTQPCSYEEYLGKKQTPWVNPTEILSVFMKKYPTLTYETFIKANDHTVDVTPFPTLED
jgi:hypothetical protein